MDHNPVHKSLNTENKQQQEGHEHEDTIVGQPFPDIISLQRKIGNRATIRYLQQLKTPLQRTTYNLTSTQAQNNANQTNTAAAQDITAQTRGNAQMSQQEQDALVTVVSTARDWLTQAISQIDVAINELTTPMSGSVNDDGIAEQALSYLNISNVPILKALRDYCGFSAEEKKLGHNEANLTPIALSLLTQLKPRLYRIQKGLDSDQEIVDITKFDKFKNSLAKIFHTGGLLRGYVRGAAAVTSGRKDVAPGRIHVNFSELVGNPLQATRTLVHEASHKYLGTEDHAYSGDCASLTLDKALNNADSIAYTVAIVNGFTA